jgi:hypothetical protein
MVPSSMSSIEQFASASSPNRLLAARLALRYLHSPDKAVSGVSKAMLVDETR